MKSEYWPISREEYLDRLGLDFGYFTIKVGETFNRYGTEWIALAVTHEENERFVWENVKAKWSGFGPAPLWPGRVETFHMNRRKKHDSE